MHLSSLLKISIRKAKRNPFNFLVNLISLGLGFTTLILVITYVAHENSYDSFHQNYENIYRLTDPWGSDGIYTRPAILPNPWAQSIAMAFPEVEQYTRVNKRLRFNPLLTYNEVRSFEDGFIEVDSTFFDIFSFKLIAGDPETALNNPSAILLTKEKAQKYFGDENPMGQIMTLNNNVSLTVTGILEDIPSNSHMHFNFVRPITNLNEFNWVYSYFKLLPETSLTQLQGKLIPFLKGRFMEKYFNQEYNPLFQPLSEIHLKSKLTYEFKQNGNTAQLYLLLSLGLVVMLLGSINYINISTAMTSDRALEFGIRKTFGAPKKQLLIQSLFESILIALSAISISMLTAYLVLPGFGLLFNKTLDMSFVLNHLVYALIIALVVGVLSGLYPAMILSRLKPKSTLAGNFKLSKKGIGFRKLLVVTQFTLSFILIFGTIGILNQLKYVNEIDVGFDREQIVKINGRTINLEQNGDALKTRFLSLPSVQSVGFSQTVPGDYSNMANIAFNFEGRMDERVAMRTIFVDEDFVETLGIEMVSGRNFSDEIKSDSAAFVFNESALKVLGWESAINKKCRMTIANRLEGKVIGVMKDFNFTSLHEDIEPLMLVQLPAAFRKVLVRIDTRQDLTKTISALQNEWNVMYPNQPFDYQFLDQDFVELYQADQLFFNAFRILALIAIFLACIGLYGMMIFDIKARLKEIGVRKVVGASLMQIVLLINKKILVLLVFSVIVGFPVAYLLLENWLSNFAYRMSIKPELFIISTIILLVVAIGSVLFKVYEAARTNPAIVLRNE
ncbi:MAG: FtsX-like permease family protein [Cyclobacteriaceae bacterium]